MSKFLELYLKNDRSILTGAMLFDAVMREADGAEMVMVKFVRPLTTQPIVTDEPPSDSDQVTAEFSYYFNGERFRLWVVASDLPILERRDIDETRYLDGATLLNGSIWQLVENDSDSTFIERLIALNKVLIEHEFGLTGFWFVKLTLQRYQKGRSFIRIITGKNMADTIFDTILLDENDEKFGQIRFVKK